MNRPSTESELLIAAARALAARDGDAIQQLASIAADWMQPESEAAAQRHILEVMAEAAYLLEGEESEFATEAEGEAE